MPEPTFIEADCVIEHNGRKFKSGGAWLCDCTDGYRRGVVYAKPDVDRPASGMFRDVCLIGSCGGTVTTWHGEKIADAHFGAAYFGGFGARMRSVTFTVDGVTYSGRYGFDNSQAVRVRSTRKIA